MAFGERLRQLRKKANINAEKVAMAAGVKRRMVFLYENNTAKPSFDVLLNIADFFNVSVDFLVGRSDDPRCEEYRGNKVDAAKGLDFSVELAGLLTFTSRVAIAIRQYSSYGNPQDPNAPEDVRILSDCLHNLSDLSEAIIAKDMEKAAWSCDFLASKIGGCLTHPAFTRNMKVQTNDPIALLAAIKNKIKNGSRL